MSIIRNLLKRTEAPIYLQILIGVLTIIVSASASYYFTSVSNSDNRKAQAFINDVRSFEYTSNEFNVFFSAFAYKVLKNNKIDEIERRNIMKNIGSQYEKVTSLKYQLPPEDGSIVDNYRKRIFELRNSIRDTNSFEDLGVTYGKIAKMLKSKELLIKRLRRRAGLLGSL